MNDIDHVDILTKLIFEIAFEKVEKSDIEKPIFQGGAKDSNPPPCTGRVMRIYVEGSMLQSGFIKLS